ncbi:hypothetical protein DL98DRAFT_610100 [Cadophora sp. DSE1049]|nr:hypothetical protein DL98DRAFT_610100 [Cadophora sp. DSE1049]
MRLSTFSSLIALGLSTTALADSMIVYQYCYLSCTYPATFTTSAGTYDVNAADGCRGTSVPGMTEFCIEWCNSRGHFKYSHQNYKRCMVITSDEWYDCGIASCYYIYWNEVGCSWPTGRVEGIDVGEVEGEEGEVESVPATASTTAVATATFAFTA